MVKVMNPFFSQMARGKFAGIVYQTGPNGQKVRTKTLQRKKPSDLQLQQNYAFGVAAEKWKELTPEQKKLWDKMRIDLSISPYNSFIKHFMKKTDHYDYVISMYE